MIILKCSNCGADNNEGVKFCKKCGSKLQQIGDNYTYADNSFSYEDTKTESKKTYKKWPWIILIVFLILIASAIAVFFAVFDGSIENLPIIGENTTETTAEVTTTTDNATKSSAATTEPFTLTSPQIVVPDLSGLHIDDAKEKLDNVGLKCEIIYTQNQSVQIDYVISQSPISGRNAKKMKLLSYMFRKVTIYRLHRQKQEAMLTAHLNLNMLPLRLPYRRKAHSAMRQKRYYIMTTLVGARV